MKTRNIFIKSCLICLITLIGTLSLAEDKRNLPSNTANPPRQDCPESSKKNSNPNSSTPAPDSITGKKITDPESLTPPPIIIQEGTNAEG